MKKSVIISVFTTMLFVVVPVTFSGWSFVKGEGPVQSETRELPLFTGIVVEGSMDVNLVQSSDQSVMIKAEENILKLIETDVDDSILVISSKESYRTKIGVKIDIHVAAINNITVKGSGDISVSDGIAGEYLKLNILGSGDLDLRQLDVEDLNCNLKGSGDIVVSGSATTASYKVYGSGDVQAINLKADTVSVAIKGSGDVAVYAAKTLDASILGSGDIMYTGDAEITKRISGSGDISKK